MMNNRKVSPSVSPVRDLLSVDSKLSKDGQSQIEQSAIFMFEEDSPLL